MFSNLGRMATNIASTAAKAIPTAQASLKSAPAPAPAPAAAPQQRTPAPPPRRGGLFGRMRMFSSGGSTGSASKRADGIAKRGKTKGTFV